MAASDARPVPKKNTAYRLYLAIRKNDGTLCTGWTGQDTELSLDGASFADATNEATEIGSSGVGYIDLTSGELNADCVVVKTTVTNSGALPFVATLFPEETGDIRVDATAISGDSTAADNLEAACDGTGYNLGGGSIVAASVTGAVGSVTGNVGGNVAGSVASVTGNVGGNVAGSVGSVAGNVAGNVVGSVGSVATDVGITQAAADKVWSSASRTLTSFGTLVSDIWSAVSRTLTSVADSSGVTTLLSRVVGTLAAGTHQPQSGDAYARLGAPAGASISADIATVDTVVDAIKAKTDTLPASPAAVGSAMTLEDNAITAAKLATDAGAEIVAAWASTAMGSPTSGTYAHALRLARALAAGKLDFATADTMKLYDTDGTTLLATLTLAPSGGPFTTRTP